MSRSTLPWSLQGWSHSLRSWLQPIIDPVIKATKGL
ncbi:MAG: hypothetical protein QOC71_358 [Thermoplasmata archaeon]|jgi:hypothetical protein|nr:hypothetical protein [Thermoplasmata archaeon]